MLSYLLFLVHQLYAQEQIERDSVIVSATSVFMDYCTSNDSALEFAKIKGIPVKYPMLIVNGVIIRNINIINTIRNSIHGENKRLLGPYHIIKYRRYSQKQSMPFKINEVPLDGVVIITLRRDEILDISDLESWNRSNDELKFRK